MTADRILVTGGAGFIGSHLVEALLESGYSVRVLDDLSSGKLSNLPIDRCHLTLVVGDVADAPTVERAMKDCSAVVHLAAVASVQASVDDPVATHQSNFVGTLNICEAMRQAGVRRVVYASSAAIYGNNGEGMAITEDTPKNPLTPYAVDKLASEHFLDFYRRQHGLEPVILRFFNIYGPRQDPSSPYSGVISIFSERAQKKLPITVYGDGEQTRDFVYVNDLVKVLVQAVSEPEPINEPVNVGFNRSTSVNELAATLSELLGRSLTLNYDAPRSGDIKHSRADNSRLLERFSLSSPTCFTEGLGQLLRSIDSGGR
jgi:UDP-glucose 4-epimerase